MSETVELREAGINCFMMVLGGIPHRAIPAVVTYNLVASIYDNECARLLFEESIKNNTVTKVHMKINTGLSRLGVCPGKELDEFVPYIKTLKGLEIDGSLRTFLTQGQKNNYLRICN